MFKWLAFGEVSTLTRDIRLNVDGLAVAITLDVNSPRPDQNILPSAADISEWQGNLIRRDGLSGKLIFCHFSVKEFLLLDEIVVPNSTARKSLLNEARGQVLTIYRKTQAPILSKVIRSR